MASDPGTVRRYSRATRWFHALTYLTVLILLGTGWWLVAGREGQPSVAARLTGIADTSLHRYAGWVLTALAASAVTLGVRATRTFVRESLRHDRGDLRWFARWPGALVTGRFARHEGHFDPGQRAANLLMVGLFVALIGSGIGLVLVTGGPWFVWLQRVHRWATYLITPVLIGHIVIAAGLPPGYRGVARAMHLGGRLPLRVAERVWPGWLDRHRGVQHDS
ncbi:formate dehydrogenase subunit gamma [Micromonospora kangleipakensis]|uniref:Formate dehydrogenase subunit gamma n=1 Tax=Micromonospora kangleipakensis TaxID=1077942 RepID=A0A4Q8BE39_9ACTN|nr:cytochrome b/b6 domain-containing protein [Micromonospora kangleipakensis]RZU76187.1 formate dehydrogenase subunit gamma [Micromonospora kangleipakensis]